MSLAHYVLVPLLFLSQLVLHSAQNSSQHQDCCWFKCGSLGEIGYPFYRKEHSNCSGVIAVNCSASQPKAQFREGKWYPVNDINYLVGRMEILDEDLESYLLSNRCDSLEDFSEQAYLKNFNEELAPTFISFNIPETRPIFKCKRKSNFTSTFFNQFDYFNCTDYDLYYNKNQEEHLPSLPANLSHNCSVVHLPSARVPDNDTGTVKHNLTLIWGADFGVNWQVLPACVDVTSVDGINGGGKCPRAWSQSFQCSKKDESV